MEQHQNFEEKMQGMKTQLIQLSTLLRLLDLAFWNYLGLEEGGLPGSAGPSPLSVLSPQTPPFFLCRGSGFRLPLLLFPLAVDPVQEGAGLPGRAAPLGGGSPTVTSSLSGKASEFSQAASVQTWALVFSEGFFRPPLSR